MVGQHQEATIETTDVGFTFAGGETDAASTNIWIPHSEFPQGISVSVVSIESTPFLIGLDVIREYGLVIDYHYNRVYSHETLLSLCNSSDDASCFGDDAEQKRIGTAPSVESFSFDSKRANKKEHKRKASLSHHVILGTTVGECDGTNHG